MTRRDFVKQAAVGAGVAAVVGSASSGLGQAQPDTALPEIELGNFKVSRLVLGSNPFFGFSHYSDELSREMVEYYTDERICEVLDEAASHGITAVAAPSYERWIKLYGKYRDQGGKLRTWLAQPDRPVAEMQDDIRAAVDGGANAVFVQGARVEEAYGDGKLDKLGEWVELIRGLGVPAGLASHRPDIHPEVEKAGLPTSFYYQCFYVPDGDWRDGDPPHAVETIRKIEKPVIGYKILAAGRRNAEEAFRFALESIKPIDGVCVGMFPKHDPEQIAKNAELARRFSQTDVAAG